MLNIQITFKGLDASPALEERIRELAEKLAHLDDGPGRCQVVVEAPHRHHLHGRQYQVRVHLTRPGVEIDVSHVHGHDRAHEDPYVAARDAFLAARRQLDEQLDRRRELA